MTNLNFIAEIIKKNWFQETTKEYKHEQTFYEDIKDLNVSQLTELLFLLLECLDVRVNDEEFNNIIISLKKDKTYKLKDVINKDIIINKDLLVKFLICITLSEYRIDDILLYPKEMRYQKLKEISEAIGLEQNMVLKIDSNWHGLIRQKVFPIPNS